MASKPRFSVFISSPHDVLDERVLARDVIERLSIRFRYVCEIKPVLWEWEPLRADRPFPDTVPKPSDSDIVVVILWSRLGFDLPDEDRFRGPDGRTLTGTEWEFMDAHRALTESGGERPDLLVFRKQQAPVIRVESDEQLDEFRLQSRRLNDFFGRYFQEGSGSFVGAFREFKEIDEFESALEESLRKLIQNKIEAALGSDVADDRWIVEGRGSPFRGLASFEVEDAPIFFGRTKARHDLRNLLKNRIDGGCAAVLIAGSSGSGKSSLAKAGLLADLKKQDVIGGVALCRHVVIRPSDAQRRPFRALADTLFGDALPEIAASYGSARDLEDALKAEPGSAIGAISAALDDALIASGSRPPWTARLALLVDQLEELFTVVDMAERAPFVGSLAALASSGVVWVVGTLRQDFLHRIREIPGLYDLFRSGIYFLEQPRRDEISQIIRRPAQYAGLRFEQDADSGRSLANDLEREAEADPHALPLLEFVLERLFEHRSDDGVLRFAEYYRMGRLSGAIAQRAADATGQVSEAERPELDAVLRALITVGNLEARPTAAWADRARLESNATRARIVSSLLDARLLVAAGDANAARVRLVHEALIDNWDKLKQVATDHRHFLQVREELQSSVRRYNKEPDASYLLSGRRLYEAASLLDLYGEEFDDASTGGGTEVSATSHPSRTVGTTAFIRTSLEHAERQRQDSERRAAEELDRQKRFAASERKVAKQQKFIGAAAVAVALIAGGAALLLFHKEQAASELAADNDRLRQRAEAALDAQETALAELHDAWDAVAAKRYEEGFRHLKRGAELARNSELSEPSRAVLLKEVADGYYRLAGEHSEVGTLTMLRAARDTYDEAVALLPSPVWQQELAELVGVYAERAEKEGDLEHAVAAHARAATLLLSVLEQNPADIIGCRCKIATHHLHRSLLLVTMERKDEALEAVQAAIGVHERWMKDEPDNMHAKDSFVGALRSVQFIAQEGDFPKLEWQARARALEVLRERTSAEPENVSAWFSLSEELHGLSALARSQDRKDVLEDARRELSRTIEYLMEHDGLKEDGESVDFHSVANAAIEAGRYDLAFRWVDRLEAQLQSDRLKIEGSMAAAGVYRVIALILEDNATEGYRAFETLAAPVTEGFRKNLTDFVVRKLQEYQVAGHNVGGAHIAAIERIGGKKGPESVGELESPETRPEPTVGPTGTRLEPAVELTTEAGPQPTVEAALGAAREVLAPLSPIRRTRLHQELSEGTSVSEALKNAFGLKNAELRQQAEKILCSSLPSLCS